MYTLFPTERPDLLTPLDSGFRKYQARLDTYAYPTTTFPKGDPAVRSGLRSAAKSRGPSDDEPTPSVKAIGTLRSVLPYGTILQPHDTGYEAAIFIGNSLYKFKSPAAVVLPRTTDDIITIVNCARQTGVPLSIKNGGHSYAAYSLNYGGIVMDLSMMKHVEINKKSTHVTIEAGCIWKDVYAKFVRKDVTNMVVGGQCPYVGVSGFTLGGGLSPFTRSYGMGIDSVIEMTVVTASGQKLVLNKKELELQRIADASLNDADLSGDDLHDKEERQARRDLFWALRGGGGGNFAVLTEFKSELHPLKDDHGEVCCGQLSWELPEQETEFKAAMKTLNETDWPRELTIDAIWRHEDKRVLEPLAGVAMEKQLLGEMTVIYNGGKEQFDKVVEPLFAHNPRRNTVLPMLWKRWVIIEEGYDIKSHYFHHHASFIFGKGGITPELVDKVTALMKESRTLLGERDKSHFLWDHMGGKSADYKKDSTAFYWRDGEYASNFKVQWESPEQTSAVLSFMERVKETLSPYALQQKAAYLNYIDNSVQNWQEAYYGSNYKRLQKIKSHWDPKNIFRFDQGVEPMEEVDLDYDYEFEPAGEIATTDEFSIFSWARRSETRDVSRGITRGTRGTRSAEGPRWEQDRWRKYAIQDDATIARLQKAVGNEVFEVMGAERFKMLNEEIEARG